MKQAEDKSTIDALDAPGVRRQRGRPPEGPPKSWAEIKAAQRARAKEAGGPVQVTFTLGRDLAARLDEFMVGAKAREGDALTKSQVVERILRNQLMRKRG